MDILSWLKTKEGLRGVLLENSKRTALDISDIRAREEMIVAEQINVRNGRIKRVGVTRKIKMFHQDDPHYMHGISDEAQAVSMGKAAEDLIEKHVRRIIVINKSIDRLTKQTKMPVSEQKRSVSYDLLHKYVFIVHAAAILPLRKYADQNGLARPWDGENGLSYRNWARRHRGGDTATALTTDTEYGMTRSKNDDDDDDESGSESAEDSGTVSLQGGGTRMTHRMKTLSSAMTYSRQAAGAVLQSMRKAAADRDLLATDLGPSKFQMDFDDGAYCV